MHLQPQKDGDHPNLQKIEVISIFKKTNKLSRGMWAEVADVSTPDKKNYHNKAIKRHNFNLPHWPDDFSYLERPHRINEFSDHSSGRTWGA